MTTDRELLQMALDALEKNKRTHYYCEDTWYSCPKHEDGCANDAEGDECNCGADRINTVLDKTIKALRARLEQPEQAPTNNGRYLTGYKAQPEQEPYCYTWDVWISGGNWEARYGWEPYCGGKRPAHSTEAKPLYPAPQQRNWVGLTDEEQGELAWSCGAMSADWLDFARAIEAKLKEKNDS